MAFTLTYTSTRSEVMRHYFVLWKRTLWPIHALVFSVVSLIALALLPSTSMGRGGALALGCASVAVLIIFPLLSFKSQVRILTVDAHGLTTHIADKHGTVAWDDIARVEHDDDCIKIVRKNMNAFIVPRRAFSSDTDMAAFHAVLCRWHAKQA